MRLAWSLVVAWCMVVATTTHGTREAPHRAGIAAATAYHHPLRHRDISTLTPFVAPTRVAIDARLRPVDLAASSVRALCIVVATFAPVARGPPVG
ncbi:MAG: hypothetical protein ABI591_07320 [Kofleriaceae bacterium]